MPHDVVSAAVHQAVFGAAPWPWEELRAAAMLHSEACLAATDKARACEFHIMQAERLLERTVALSARQEDFAWRWYRVMPHMLNAVGQKSLARGVDRQATEKWRSDRVRADYLQGLELESKGSHEAVLQTPSGPNSYDKGGIRASYFAKAGELFTRAFKQRPDLTVAALHLGRIRMLQGNGAEAALLFRSALTDVDPAVRYLASLFLGASPDESGRGISSGIPSDTVLRKVTTDKKSDEVMIDLSSDIFTIEGEALAQAFAQIVWTATEPGSGGFRQVRFSVDGEPTPVLDGDGAEQEGPVRRADYGALAPLDD
jgi:hypothetical protein